MKLHGFQIPKYLKSIARKMQATYLMDADFGCYDIDGMTKLHLISRILATPFNG